VPPFAPHHRRAPPHEPPAHVPLVQALEHRQDKRRHQNIHADKARDRGEPPRVHGAEQRQAVREAARLHVLQAHVERVEDRGDAAVADDLRARHMHLFSHFLAIWGKFPLLS